MAKLGIEYLVFRFVDPPTFSKYLNFRLRLHYSKPTKKLKKVRQMDVRENLEGKYCNTSILNSHTIEECF
jgi:hypothetical protein